MLALGVYIRRVLEDPRPATLQGMRMQVLDLWELEMRGHFEVEETELFPQVRERVPDAALVDRLIREHRETAAAMEALRKASPDALEGQLRSLRRMIIDHVRTEERVLFEAVQGSLDEAELSSVGDGIERALPKLCVRLGAAEL